MCIYIYIYIYIYTHTHMRPTRDHVACAQQTSAERDTSFKRVCPQGQSLYEEFTRLARD